MIGHRTRYRENDYLPIWRGLTAKKKPPFFNAPVMMTEKLCAVEMRNAILHEQLLSFLEAFWLMAIGHTIGILLS